MRHVRIVYDKKEAVLTVEQEARIDDAAVAAALKTVSYKGHVKTP